MNTKYREQLHADLQKAWDTYEPEYLRCHANVVYKVMAAEALKAGSNLSPGLAADLAAEMAFWVFTDLHKPKPKA